MIRPESQIVREGELIQREPPAFLASLFASTWAIIEPYSRTKATVCFSRPNHTSG